MRLMLKRVVGVRERDLKFIYRAWDLKSQGNEGKKPSPPLLPGRDRRNAGRAGVRWSWKNGEMVVRWMEDVSQVSRRLHYGWRPKKSGREKLETVP